MQKAQRGLSQRVSPLQALCRRCSAPLFKQKEVMRDAMTGLLDLRAYVDRHEHSLVRCMSVPFAKFCERDAMLIADVLQKVPIEPNVASHGRRAAMLTMSLPKYRCDETVWFRATSLCEAGLRGGEWDMHDIRTCVTSIARWGAYDRSLVLAIEAYVGQMIGTASNSNLPVLLSILTALPETGHSPLMQRAAERVIQLAEILTPAAIGHISACFNKVQFKSITVLAALEEQAIRFAEECDLYSAIQFFCFIAPHEAEAVSVDAIKCLVERIVEDESLDANALMGLCRATKQLPRKLRPELQSDLKEMISFLSTQTLELLDTPEKDGGLQGQEVSVELLQLVVSRVLSVSGVLSKDELPETFFKAADRCAAAVMERVEDIVSDESPPFSLVPHLFEVGTEATTKCAASILHEAAEQNIPFPTLQTYRFLLDMGDHELRDKVVYRHLRNQFAQTATGIPMIQLCAALKCFSRGLVTSTTVIGDDVAAIAEEDLEELVNKELEGEEMTVFMSFCEEIIMKAFSTGTEMCCVLSSTESMYQLGYRKPEYYDSVVEYLHIKVSTASPEVHNAETAAVVAAALGPDRLQKFKTVQTFLQTVMEKGTVGEEELTPSQWMNLNDPANSILPLTDEQKHGWLILDKMRATRSADTDALTVLAREYITLLTSCRPDDLKHFFAMFDEKVFKNDKVLKDALDHLVSTGIVPKLSGYTIASILHSLAGIKFSFYGSTKKFLLAISEEQWCQIDAAALVQITSGMAKLSLRLPAVLLQISDRIVVVCRFLSPMDTALLINSLQSLGVHDEMVLSMLMKHAASSVTRFDEVALTMLFGSQSIHRLLTSPESSQPLLQRAIGANISPHLRQRIAASVKRSALPREMIQATVSQMAPLLSGGASAGALQQKQLQLE